MSKIIMEHLMGIFPILIMIILISLLVLVHEMGHFMAARMCGITVSRFGFGMPIGPSLKMFSWHGTDFYLHAFLFGGYVSFLDDEESFEEEKDKNSDEKKVPSDSPELYENKTIAQKLFVVSAGVIMNIIFAIILVMFCALVFHKLPTTNQNIYVHGFAEEQTSNASLVGIKSGDKIIKVNDTKISSLSALTLFAQASKLFDNYAEQSLIDKNLLELKKLNPNIKDIVKANQLVILPKTMEEEKVKISPDVLIGLERYKKEGIKLTEEQIKLRDDIYGKKRYKANVETSLNDIAYALSDTYKPASITVLRNNKEITFDNIRVDKTGRFGIMLKVEDIYEETRTFKDICVKSLDYTWNTTVLMLKGLVSLFTGKVKASDMHGVIAVVKVGGDIIAAKGILNGILLTAMISINLAIMNFLPIPALDGGHVMFLLIEKLTGKKPTKEFAEKINTFFFVLLIILMIAICYNDIYALITKKF